MTETIKLYKDTPILRVYIDDDAPGVIISMTEKSLVKVINETTVNYAPATEAFVFNEVPSGAVNGSNATYTSSYSFSPESVEIYLNGVKQKIIDDYNLSGGNNILFNVSPHTGEIILINYIKT